MNLDDLTALLPRSIPLGITPERLSALLRDAVAGQPRIRQAGIVCLDGSFRMDVHLRVAGAELACTTRLGIDEITLSPQRRVIALRRLEQERVLGDSPLGAAAAWLLNALLGPLGVDLPGIGLRLLDGVTADRTRIIVDLDHLGFGERMRVALAEAITQAVNARVPQGLAGAAARLGLQSALPAFAERTSAAALDHLQIGNIRISATQGLTGELMLAGIGGLDTPG